MNRLISTFLLAGIWVGFSVLLFFVAIFTPLGEKIAILVIPMSPLMVTIAIESIVKLYPHNSQAQWLVAIPLTFVVSFITLFFILFGFDSDEAD